MEIKATLNKPYSDTQRADFIVAQNHNLGYEIRETSSALEAWGDTADEAEQKRHEAKVESVKAERRTLLEESDLWMLLDRYELLSTEQQTELKTYRQALRDVTEQAGFPDEVVWPTKPTWFNPENAVTEIDSIANALDE